MTSPGPAFQERTGSCHENVSAPKAVSSDLRSTDGLTVLAWIEIVAVLVHYQPSCNTSHTMKVHYETQWPTAACWCHFVLRDQLLTLVVYIVSVGPLFVKMQIVRDHLLGLPCCDQQSVQSWQSIDHSKAKSVLLNLAKSLAVAEQCMEAAACAAWAASEAVARAAASKWLWWSRKYLLFSSRLPVFLKSKIFSQ